MLNNTRCGWLLLLLLFLIPAHGVSRAQQDAKKVVRVAVIGGMIYSELWTEIAARFEKHSQYQVVLVAAGERPELRKVMEQGKVDLLTMHSGDITTDLVADGYGVHMRPWTRNDLVIWGPAADPAGVRGMKDGAQALARIAESRSPWIDFQGIGPREMAHNLWRRAGIRPVGEWVLKDDLPGGHGFLKQVAAHHAYIITGRMPVLVGKWEPTSQMEILVEDDPTMRRPYIVMEANPARHGDINVQGARALADFLLSEEIQRFLARYDGGVNNGRPLFYPVWPWCGTLCD